MEDLGSSEVAKVRRYSIVVVMEALLEKIPLVRPVRSCEGRKEDELVNRLNRWLRKKRR